MRSTARFKHRFALATVVAVCAALVTGIAGSGAAEAASVPSPVTGVKVTGQTWNTRSLTIQWAKASGATSYAAKWSTQSNFSNPTWGSTTGTTLTIGSLTPAATYYFVVAGKNAAGSGRYSAVLQIKLKPQSVGQFGAVTATPTKTGVRVTFASVPNASAYRVRWSAGPNENRVPDRWTEHYSSWFSAFSSKGTWSYDVPMSAADLTSTAFGNPIYVRLQARNTYYNTTYIRKSPQVHAWPTPVSPTSDGVDLRVSSYNVMCSGCEPASGKPWSTRAAALVSNITSAAPDVLTVQEASGASGSTANRDAYQDLDARLGSLQLAYSGTAPTGATEGGTRILFNPSKLTLQSQGYLSGVKDYRTYPQSTAKETSIPWAAFSVRAQPSTRFIVVAAHYGLPSASYGGLKKSLLGTNSAQVLASLTNLSTSRPTLSGLPVIFAGDLNDHRYPENETNGAQPTLVRGGFYDASASLRRIGTDKPTYNGFTAPSTQVSDPNQDGLRIDYILTRGMSGSSEFENRWNPGTSVLPSDHNLISAILKVPTAA